MHQRRAEQLVAGAVSGECRVAAAGTLGDEQIAARAAAIEVAAAAAAIDRDGARASGHRAWPGAADESQSQELCHKYSELLLKHFALCCPQDIRCDQGGQTSWANLLQAAA